jgi:hypothetical protein
MIYKFKTFYGTLGKGHGIYKANVDRAIFKSEGKMGVRVIVRDGEGKVMGALSEKMPGRLAVEEVEALAM